MSIAYKLVCDKCHRSGDSLHPSEKWTKTDVRATSQEEGWRFAKGSDLCPECAVKVLGVIGAAARRNYPLSIR